MSGKEEFLSTQFSEEDVDDNFIVPGEKDTNTEKGTSKEENEPSEEEIAQEAQETLEAEAEEKGISIEELSKQKDAENVIAAEEEALEEEAESLGITIDELKEQKEKEAKDTEQKELEVEAKKTGKSVEDLKKEKETSESKTDDFDLFGDFKELTTDDKSDDMKFDYSSTIKTVGLELDEGEEIKTQEAFIAKVKKGLEDSRQKLNLDEYPPEVKLVIESLKKNNGLTATDWYRNDTIRQADNFLNKSEKEKATIAIRTRLEKQDGLKGDELIEATRDQFDELTDDEIKSEAKSISANVIKMRNKELNAMVSEKSKWLDDENKRDEERAGRERENLARKLEKMDKFLGFPIPEQVIKSMVKDVNSGAFQKYLDQNVEETKILAYLASRLGTKLEKGLSNLIAKERSSSYKKGTDVITKHKHNIRKDTSGTGRGVKSGSINGQGLNDNLFEESQ